jgi:hypothetical protein
MKLGEMLSQKGNGQSAC